MTAATAQTVQYLNLAYFGRPADPASQAAFPTTGMTDEEIVLSFVKTSEYQSNTVIPSSVADSTGGRTFNITSLVNTFYQRLFGRNAATVEVAGWSNAITSGAVNYDYLGITIMRAGLNLPAGTAMRDVLVAKYNSAQAFSDKLAADSTAAAAYSTNAAIAEAQSYLSAVTTSTAATSAALDATVSSITSPVTAGSRFVLTSETDSVVGTSGTDTIIAGAGTIVSGDFIDGGAGSDTLNATFTADTTILANISNVETINLRANGNDVDVTLDMDSVSGATAVYADRLENVSAANAASVTVNNLALGTTVGISGGAAATTSAGDVTFAFKGATGSSDSVSLDLKGGIVNALTVGAIETVNVATSSSAVTLNSLAAAAATNLVVTGDQDLTITTAFDFANATDATAIDGTLDASAFTGNLTIGANAGDIVSFTGGSGNDTFAMTTGLATTDVLVGGAGTDTVSVTGVADGATLDLSTFNFTGIETFSVQGAAGADANGTDVTVAADAAGISNLTLVESAVHADGTNGQDEGDYTVTGLTSGNTIKLVNDKDNATAVSQIGTVTLSLLDGSATDDVLTVELAGTTAQTAIENTVDDLAVTNVETLNIVSTNSGTGLATDALTATDDNTLGDISSDTLLTTLNISGSDQANITVGGEVTNLATVNTSGMSDDLTLTLQAVVNQVVTGGAANETVAFGTTLNNSDTVDLGAGTDVVSATVTGSTATTGALSISNVETINLTNAGTSVIDASGITGASEIAVLTNTTSTTVTGLAAGTAIGLGHNNTDGAVTGLFNVSLADSSGSADALTFNLNDTEAGNTNIELTATGIETVTLAQTDTTDTSLGDYTFDVDSLNASNIIISGADADLTNAVTLTLLDTETTSVDATGYHGIVTATASAAVATTFSMRGGVAHTLTGSSGNDTFNFTGLAVDGDDMVLDGNGGTDVANILLATGAQDFDNIADIDTLNFSASGTVAITTNADGGVLDGINAATSTTFTGGNSISTVTLGGSAAGLSAANSAVIDFSGWNGALADATFDQDAFDTGEAGITVQVIGSSLADTVSASYSAGTDALVQLNMQGVETFDVDLANHGTEMRIDMALVTGLTRINVTDASSESVEFFNLGTGTTIDVLSDNAVGTRVETVLADATGSADSQTFIVGATDAEDEVDLVAADIETINISVDTANRAEVDLSGISMTAATATNTVNFTGTNDLELIATGTDIATIDASGMGTGGAVVQTGRTRTASSTYTGSAGDDTFIMLNISDTLSGGAGTDTLDINATQAVGTAIIDLSAADQISSYNGGLNAAVQSGFENVDLAGVASNGAVITGSSVANVIVGSSVVDQIDGGAGADTITSGDGADNLTGGAGADTFNFAASINASDVDTITDFTAGAGGDVMGIGNLDATFAATLAVATLDAAGGTLTSLGGTATAADVDVLVLLDTSGFANVGAAEDEYTGTANDVTDDDGLVVVYYDSAVGYVRVAFDAAEGTDSGGGVTVIADLTSLTAATDLADFTAANFAV